MDASLYEAHDRLEDTHWWFEGRRQVIARVLEKRLHVKEGRRILDVGCGTGGMFPLLARFGEVEGAEYSPDARERAARRFPGVKVSPCVLPADLPQGQWDLLTAFDVLEHVDEPVGALFAMRERLAPSGQVVVTVPALQALWSRHDELNHHKRRYTRGQLEEQLRGAGLTVRYASYFNTLLFPAVAGVRALHKLAPGRFSDEGSDLAEVPAPLNLALTALFTLESRVLPRLSLPVGVSLIAVADRD